MKNASRSITDNACRRVWTFNFMNANECRRMHTHERRRKSTDADIWARTQTYGHGRRRTCTNAHVWARTYMHERTRMGTDADVHARMHTYGHGRRRTCTYEDGRGRIMGFKRTDAHARERTHTGDRRTYIRAREKNAVRGGRVRKKHAVRGGLNSN